MGEIIHHHAAAPVNDGDLPDEAWRFRREFEKVWSERQTLLTRLGAFGDHVPKRASGAADAIRARLDKLDHRERDLWQRVYGEDLGVCD